MRDYRKLHILLLISNHWFNLHYNIENYYDYMYFEISYITWLIRYCYTLFNFDHKSWLTIVTYTILTQNLAHYYYPNLILTTYLTWVTCSRTFWAFQLDLSTSEEVPDVPRLVGRVPEQIKRFRRSCWNPFHSHSCKRSPIENNNINIFTNKKSKMFDPLH